MDRNLYKKLFYPLILVFFTFFCVLLILPENSVWGSEGDWFSQHLAVAEQFRAIFYETGRILPDYSLAGAGSNIYDFSYYGLLRPDVLISFLLPGVPMAWVLSAYAILEIAAGSILCYCWLKRHLELPFFAFLGGILYSCAGCFYQSHHQLMFVNYLPFLLLALLGIDRMLVKGRHGLLFFSLVMAYLHSYYFAPSVLAVVFLYFLYRLYSGDAASERVQGQKYSEDAASGQMQSQNYSGNTDSRLMQGQKYSGDAGSRQMRRHRICHAWLRLIFSIGISVGIAAVLLLPTGLDLLSTKKDAGIPPELSEIFSIQLSMESLLYHPGGCGLTLLCLYTLLLSLRRKGVRILSAALLACLTVNTFPYLLSGLLYIRYKVLIPLIPLLLLLCTQTLEMLFSRRERHSLLCGLLCLVPAHFFVLPETVLADAAMTATAFGAVAIVGSAANRNKHTIAGIAANRNRQTQHTPAFPNKKLLPLYLLLCLPPAITSITVSSNDQFISASDSRQAAFSKADLEMLGLSENYRFDCLTEPYANVNVLPVAGIGSTAMYSSVTDSGYAGFFYNIARNPIRVRNRVALMTDANPFFAYLMGIRYIQAKESSLPLGYQPIAEKDGIVIAENSGVLPIAYTSTATMAQEEFEKLEFPYTLEALSRYTITPDASPEKSTGPGLGRETDTGTKGNTDAGPEGNTDVNLKGNTDVRLGGKTDISAKTFMETTQITPISLETLTGKNLAELLPDTPDISFQQEKDGNLLSVSLKEEMHLSLPLKEPLGSQILICSFQADSPKGHEVTIDINGIRNKLSDKHAPYPNENHVFTYLISSSQRTESLEISLKPGKYLLSEFQFWTMGTAQWGNPTAAAGDFSQGAGGHLLEGTVSCREGSYFVTSFPYRNGYQAKVDGEPVPIQKVNTSFVGFPLTAGSHEIALSYQPPGKTAAVAISMASLLLFSISLFWERYEIYRNYG